MLKDVLVLGAGSAGLLAALTLKKKLPQIRVRIVRSPDIGVIGVGEGTTPAFPQHLFRYLRINPGKFLPIAEPTWKIGIRFMWGPRPVFYFSLLPGLDAKWSDLRRENGYYCEEEFDSVNICSALMSQGKVASRNPQGGGPEFQSWHAFHVENKKLVNALEAVCVECGVEIIDGKVQGAQRGPMGFSSVVLDDGRVLEAEFFVDASGFRSELLGRALAEPYISFDKSLFCDRAVVGGWERTTEPILPYTTAETMEAGWCWQIEHENFINRGYVYSSRFMTEEQATLEYQRKNPKAPATPRVVKFRSGRYQRACVDNVVAIGNSCGFVEPLEATALNIASTQCQMMIDILFQDGELPSESTREMYNAITAGMWDEIRDFLALHYRFNTRLETPFWQAARAETDVSGCADLIKFYQEHGPSGLCRHYLRNIMATGNHFGTDGFLVILVGNKTPYRRHYPVSPMERQIWEGHRDYFVAQARNGLDVKEALAMIRHPGWKWLDQSNQPLTTPPPRFSPM